MEKRKLRLAARVFQFQFISQSTGSARVCKSEIERWKFLGVRSITSEQPHPTFTLFLFLTQMNHTIFKSFAA